MPKLYLNVEQLNAPNAQRLRVLQNELPERLNVHDGLEDGTHRVWVYYPDRYGEDKARAEVAETIARLEFTTIAVAD